MSANAPAELKRIYDTRFDGTRQYRERVWTVLLSDFFQKHIGPTETVLDLGCGYGEFINQVQCGKKYAMDLNPNAQGFLNKDVTFLEQDCSTRWNLPDSSMDAVFTSNFFEHLPDKASLGRTLDEAIRCLAPGGRLIAMGPNIKYLQGEYWEFWDHHLPLTENSLKEALVVRAMEIELCKDRFLPHTIVNSPEYPMVFLRIYLKLPPAWRLLGKQFLVIARKS